MKKRKLQLELHAKRRALERFGIALREHEYQFLVGQARRGEPIKRQSINRKICRVTMPNGSPALAVYDHARRAIATFMPMGARI